jgi:hypothetical protein
MTKTTVVKTNDPENSKISLVISGYVENTDLNKDDKK